MGQAFRRAAGKLRTSTIDTPSSSSASAPSRHQKPFDHQRPPAVPVPPDDRVHIYKNDDTPTTEGHVKSNNGEVSEERDSKYEAMLSQMVGRINTKPRGKLEMGEAFVVQKSSRPLPKVRNTTPDAGRYEERPAAAGTLNVAQLRHIMRLHQGQADDHEGPMGLKEIAERFRVDALQLERILQFVSLPPEDNTRKKRPELDD